MDFRDRSKVRFSEEMQKLLKDLYVSCLDRAEKILQPDKRSDAWKQFRFGILNLGNDKIRSLDHIMRDYSIEFRPAIFSVEYKVDIPAKQLVEFEFKCDDIHNVSFSVESKELKPVELLIEALGTPSGNGANSDGFHAYWSGLYTVFNKVIPFFESNECFKGHTLERYNAWKEKVYEMEKANA